MKKLVAFLLTLILGFGVLAACGGKESDNKDLLERIEKLEQELADAKGLDGKSAYQVWLDAGNSGSQDDFFEFLKGEPGERGPQGLQGNPGEAVKIYHLGETFTYISADIELFSIKMEISINNPLYVVITIKNLNWPGAPDDFVSLQISSFGTSYSKITFSTTNLSIGDEFSASRTFIEAFNGMWYFGFPATRSITPYAIFDLN